MRSSGIFTLIIVLCLLAACGGHSSSQSRSMLPAPSISAAQSDDPYQQALNLLPADIRAEVDALVPPKGCNSALFIALKKSFVQAIASSFARGAKAVCTPPTGDNNKAAGLTVENVSGDYILSWNYRNIGDYDQGGIVSVADITPIAMHFGHTVGTDPLDTVIDGDGSGTVGISDITPLAMNFGVNVVSYRVEESVTETGEYTLMGTVSLNSGSAADQGWMRLEYTLPDREARWLRVVPLDGQGNPGVPSDSMEFGGSGTAPVIESASPLLGATNAAVQFSAVVSGVGPFSYVWNFNGAATPDSSTDEQPDVTLSGTSGDYDCSVEVTNAAGPTLFNFTVTVGAPPNATAVNQTGGVSGEDVQFTVTTTGDAPLTYAWDFGGGATPDTSVEESPIVTLGAAGVYDTASVTVTNPFGESFFGFDLTVTAAGMAPEITVVTPTSGIEATQINISASVLGTPPFTYAWDFGAAGTPSTSSDAAPSIVLNGPGDYPCSLVVDNLYGSDTYNFNLEVLPVGAYDEVEVNDTRPQANALPAPPVEDWHCRLTDLTDIDDFFSFDAVLGDRVEILMDMVATDPDFGVELQDASGNVLAASDGSTIQEAINYRIVVDGTYYIRCYFTGFTSTNAADYWLDLTITPDPMDEVENNDASVPGEANPITFPLVDFDGHCGGPIGYDGDNDDFFTFDAAEGDLLSVSMAGEDYSYDLDLKLRDGSGNLLTYSDNTGPNESISYMFTSGDIGPYYLYVQEYDESGFYWLNGTCGPPVFWDTNVIDNTPGAFLGQYSSLTSTNGFPGCFYTDLNNGYVYFAYSSDADGMGAWTRYEVDVTTDFVGTYLSGGVIDGYPAAAYRDETNGGIKFAMCTNAFGSGTWNVSVVDTNGQYDPSVAEIGGYPAVAYEDGGDPGTLFFAINDAADGSGNWTSYPVEAGSGSEYTSLIELSNGNPGISYDAYGDGEIHFATCDTPDGSGTWTVTVIDTTAVSSYPNTSAAVVQGYPAVAYYDTGSLLRYAINSSTDGDGNWTTVPVSFRTLPDDLSLAVIGGYPAILYHDDNFDMYYAVSAEIDGTGVWSDTLVLLQAESGSNRSLGFVNNKPACVYMDESDSWVGFATPSGL